MSVVRLCRALRSSGQLLGTSGRACTEDGANLARSSQAWAQQRRWMSGGHGHAVTYEGLTLHEPARWHKVMGEGLAGLMWFWIFFRAYHDGHTFLYGHAQHFEHEEHDSHH